jgi:hypothetical protein
MNVFDAISYRLVDKCVDVSEEPATIILYLKNRAPGPFKSLVTM